MYRIVRMMAVLALTSLLALAVVAPTSAAAPVERPVKGILVGQGTVVPDSSCPIGLRTVAWATGEVTHLGWTTATSTHCTPAGFDIVGGVETFVAANGDTLEMTYTGSVEPFEFVEGAFMTGPSPTVITGGTGRFANASGGFVAVMRGILHLTAPMELSFTLDGEISY